VVEHFLGKEEVVSPILINGSFLPSGGESFVSVAVMALKTTDLKKVVSGGTEV